MHLRPSVVKDALKVLQNINPIYTTIPENQQWEADCQQEDEAAWKGLTGEGLGCGDETEQTSGTTSNFESQTEDEAAPTSARECSPPTSNVETEASQESSNISPQSSHETETDTSQASQFRGVVYDTCLQEADPALLDDKSFSIVPQQRSSFRKEQVFVLCTVCN